MNCFDLTVFFAVLICGARGNKEVTQLTILHSNDIHGNFAGDDDGYGGIPKTIHMVKTIKETSTPGRPVIYLNAGDIFTGTVWYSIHRTNIAADFIRLMKPDALTLGNHEFDEGLEGLERFASKIDQPLLCANGDFTNEPNISKYMRKSVVFKPKDSVHEIGVIGYINSGTGELTHTGDIRFSNDIDAVKEEAAKLTKKGVKVIIALGHSGIETDKKLAEAVPEVDVVVGGHSHTFLYTGTPPTKEKVYGDYPIVIKRSDGVKVPVVQVGYGGRYLGRLNVSIDSNGTVLGFEGCPILLGADVPQDEQAMELLNRYRSNVTDLRRIVLAVSRVFLQGGHYCRRKECNMGNLMTDAFCQYKADKYNSGPHWTDTAIAVVNSGSFAASINASKQEGNVTAADLYGALPFGDKLITLRVNASTLLKILEYSVRSMADTTYGEFLQVSGLKIVYDMNRPPLQRVVDLKIRCAACDVPKYEEIDMNSSYRLTTTTFISKGGDGYDFLRSEHVKLFEEVTPFEIVKRYINLSGIIQPGLENRISITYNTTAKMKRKNEAIKINPFGIVQVYISLGFVYMY